VKRLLLALLVVGSIVVPASTAGAAQTGWSIVPAPDRLLPNGVLSGVSCPASDACMAVGTYEKNYYVSVSLAESWDGSTWTVSPTVNPAGASDTRLAGVSCPTATKCVAVGHVADTNGQRTLAEVWNGTTWSVKPTIDPAGFRSSALAEVSCSSATHCIAVGYFADSEGTQRTLAEAWDGSTWSVQTTPTPAGSDSAQFEGVSCPTASSCTAVGYSYDIDSNALITLAESWNGATWSIQSTPSSTYSELRAVSCVAADACTAVGYTRAGSGSPQLPIAEALNGSTWSDQATPLPAGAASGSFFGVSCTAANACAAVGSFTNQSSVTRTLAERWNGSAWSVKSSSNPAGSSGGSFLNRVSCSAANACKAAGFFRDSSFVGETLTEAWNGTSWALKPSPSPLAQLLPDELTGVSCTSASSCVAVGVTQRLPSSISVPGAPLAEVWNGSKWAIKPTPTPSGTTDPYLNGVSCSAANACVAVGHATDRTSFVDQTLVEMWNGAKWSIKPSPEPSGSTGTSLDAVSCTSAKACVAVGYSSKGSFERKALAEVWDGTKWSIVPTAPVGGSTFSFLTGVSCTGPKACVAVGGSSAGSAQVAIIETWDGQDWTKEKAAVVDGAKTTRLNGVSCTSADACVAVGQLTDGSDTQMTLVESWNGTKWSAKSSANPSDAHASVLKGVSCTASNACIAVGTSTDASFRDRTLAERWNGTTWSITPTPALPDKGFLNGVSCISAKACTAAGLFYDKALIGRALIERYAG
jgi:hypothetical protein